MVYENLVGKEFETFLPLYRNERRERTRVRTSQLPLFPGYVFCRFDPLNRLPVLIVPGIIGIVGLGKTPVAVDASEIDALRRAVSAGFTAEPVPFTEIGAPVVISDGPLRGVRGVMVRHKNSQRLVLSISLLRRSASLEVDASCVQAESASVSRDGVLRTAGSLAFAPAGPPPRR